MGCCYSYEEDDRGQTRQSAYTAAAHVRRWSPPSTLPVKAGPLYGEYKCSCGYFWTSRLSWRDKYQQCKRCKANVRPKNQRELRPTDFESSNKHEHPKELCEMCKQLGRYCGNNNTRRERPSFALY